MIGFTENPIGSDNSDYVYHTATYTLTSTLVIPEYSNWQVTLTAGTTLRPLKGKEPNWFWRKMQYLAFGFKWEKIPIQV